MKKPTIKFSHYYYKMPQKGILETAITNVFQIFVCDYKELGEKYKLWDTAVFNPNYNNDPLSPAYDTKIKHYPLPKGKLIVIYLLTAHEGSEQAFNWQTIRRWTPQKEAYYRSLIDREVKVEIAS